ncbi:hypothetical protein Cgig2_026140 [Carnegiea gigantea]|uniref:Zinc knuckle CX2CX4HX4C domain-containing protein n=1 Tax=Carnegiea gigantea TaxID=171969 RepID=A0A9Q1Q9E1_9CARY|nr:hypothetical protein Cgig2_026140 [Carnegiea gigantea]
MAEGLVEAWSRLTLTAEEEVVEVFQEEILHEKAEEIELSFLGETIDKKQFQLVAYDVLGARQTKTFAQFLGSRIGSFVDRDETFMLGVDRSLCFRVDIDVEKPLHRGVQVLMEGRQLWIPIKFVNFVTLADFCYRYGKLGHAPKDCEVIDPNTPIDALQYGTWLRASSMKFKRRNAEEEL